MPARPRLALALDILIVLALILTLVIVLTGGFFTRAGGFRISGRSPDRALLLALSLVAVRFYLDRGQTGFLGRAPGDWQRLRDRWFQRTADPIAPAPVPWSQIGLAAAGMSGVGAVLLYPQLREMYSVPDLGDPLFSIWRMGWAWRQLRGDPRALFDGNIFHPEPLTLTYSDSMLLPSLTATPLFALGVHPVIAYNVIFLLSFLFSGVATFALVRRLTGSSQAAFIAGLIYGFYPYRFEHYSHLELQMTHWMPLGLLALHRFAENRRLRDALLFAACLLAQLYSSMYYGVFFSLYSGALGLVLLLSRRVPLRRAVVPLGLAAVVTVLGAIPLARPYIAANERKGERDRDAVSFYSARPADYLRAHPRSARYGTISLPGREPERALFPGVTPIVAAAGALVPPLGTSRLAYAAGLAVAFDGSLGLNGLTYPFLYDWLSPVRGLRVPARFSIIGALSLAVLGGFGVARLLRRWSGQGRAFAFAACVLLVAIDLQPLLPLEPVWRVPPPIYGAIENNPSVVLAEFPVSPDGHDFSSNMPYMYFSFWHGASMVNGYSGFSPPGYDEVNRTLRSFPEPASLDLLRARGTTHVTVNCAFFGDRCSSLLDTLDTHVAFRRVARGVWEGQPVSLYELAR